MSDDSDKIIPMDKSAPSDLATFRNANSSREKDAGRSGKVRIIMLQSGMTIIGADYAEKNGVVYLRNPIMIGEQLQRGPNGHPQMSLQLLPFMGFAAGPVYDFNKTLTVCIMPAKPEVEAAYNEAAAQYFGTLVKATALPQDADILPFLRK